MFGLASFGSILQTLAATILFIVTCGFLFLFGSWIWNLAISGLSH